MNIINQGTWSAYTPSPYPANLPPGAIFVKSDTTGRDWYDALGYDGATPLLTAGSIAVTAIQQNGQWLTQAANADWTRVFPRGMLLLEVQGYTGTDAQTDLGYGKLYDPVAGTVAPVPVNLVAYANQKQWAWATGGYTATVNGQSVTFATDEKSYSLITGKYARFQQPNAPTSVNWQTGPTTFITISAADFTTLAVEICDFMQSTFDKLNTVLGEIAASTITTTAQIDAALQ